MVGIISMNVIRLPNCRERNLLPCDFILTSISIRMICVRVCVCVWLILFEIVFTKSFIDNATKRKTMRKESKWFQTECYRMETIDATMTLSISTNWNNNSYYIYISCSAFQNVHSITIFTYSQREFVKCKWGREHRTKLNNLILIVRTNRRRFECRMNTQSLAWRPQ